MTSSSPSTSSSSSPSSSSSSSPSSSPSATSLPVVIAPLDPEGRDRTRAVRVGVTTLVALAILVVAFAFTGPLAVLGGQHVDVDFHFCGPIKPGASVRVAGVVVGVVDDVVLLAGRDPVAGKQAMVRVRARVKPDAAHLLTSGTRFYVTTLGVLGEHYLDVDPGEGVALADGARVDGVTLARADLLLPRASSLLERADELLPTSPEAKRMMTTAAALLESLDAIVRDPEAGAQIKDGMKDARALIEDLRLLAHGAAVGVGDGHALHATLERLPPLLDKTGALEDQLLQSELTALIRDTRTTLARAQPLVAALADGPAGTAAQQQELALKLTTTLVSLDQVARRADRLLTTIENKEGAAGKLFYDDAIAADLKTVLHALREDPVKFLFR